MSKNGYLQRQKIRDQVYSQASADTERQFMVDLFCIVLNDPAVMGHNALGRDRLARVVQAVSAEYDQWKDILTVSGKNRKEDITDYRRVKFDELLGRILGDRLTPFEQRYEWIKDAPTIPAK